MMIQQLLDVHCKNVAHINYVFNEEMLQINNSMR